MILVITWASILGPCAHLVFLRRAVLELSAGPNTDACVEQRHCEAHGVESQHGFPSDGMI